MKQVGFDKFLCIVEALAQAFEDDPLYTYLAPDPVERHRFVRDFLAFRTKYLLKRCLVYADSDAVNSVMAVAPVDSAMTKLDFIGCGGLGPMLRAKAPTRRRMLDFVSYLDRCERQCCTGPHQLLGPLATRPDRQGEGLGGSLFSQVISEVCDPRATLYLDTQTPRNVPLYEKHGFYVVKEESIPGSRVTNFVMLRDARRQQ